MRKYFFISFCFLLVSTTIFGNDTGKTKIAILPFYIKGNVESNLRDLFFENFVSAINEGKIYNAVDKGSLDKAFDLLRIQKNIEFSVQNGIDIGITTRASVVVIGSITFFENEYFVSIRGIDVQSGNELFKESSQAENNMELLKLVDTFAKSIARSTRAKTNVDSDDTYKNVKRDVTESSLKDLRRNARKYTGAGIAGTILFSLGTIMIFACIPTIFLGSLGLAIYAALASVGALMHLGFFPMMLIGFIAGSISRRNIKRIEEQNQLSLNVPVTATKVGIVDLKFSF